jgi:hypothetical protein
MKIVLSVDFEVLGGFALPSANHGMIGNTGIISLVVSGWIHEQICKI